MESHFASNSLEVIFVVISCVAPDTRRCEAGSRTWIIDIFPPGSDECTSVLWNRGRTSPLGVIVGEICPDRHQKGSRRDIFQAGQTILFIFTDGETRGFSGFSGASGYHLWYLLSRQHQTGSIFTLLMAQFSPEPSICGYLRNRVFQRMIFVTWRYSIQHYSVK